MRGALIVVAVPTALTCVLFGVFRVMDAMDFTMVHLGDL